MRPQLQYIADSILIESLVKQDDIKIALGQDGGSISSTILSGLRSYVSSVFKPEAPISSLMALFSNGLLFSLGGTKIKILVILASALGFDWIGFWHNVGESVAGFVKEILDSKKPADANTTASKANEIASKAVSQSFTGSPDLTKLKELAEKGALKAFSIEHNSKLIKNASITSKIASVLIRIVGWCIITVLGMLALSQVNKAVSGNNSEKEETAQNTGKLIQISPDAPSELFSIHRNNMSSIWIEHGNIEDIENILKSWIFSAYPKLEKYESLLVDSSAFQSMVGKFQERNKLANGLGMISIPRPYQRKIDIVSMIVGTFLRAAGINEQNSNLGNQAHRGIDA
jgi:hypothetical protein